MEEKHPLDGLIELSEEVLALARLQAEQRKKQNEQQERIVRAVRQGDSKTVQIDGYTIVLNANYYHEEYRVPEHMFAMRIKEINIARTIRASEGLPFNMKQNINVVAAQNATFLRKPPANVLTAEQQERLLDKMWFLTQDIRNDMMIDAALLGKETSRERLAPLPGATEERKG